MYGVSEENTIRFMQHIVDTNGNPTSEVAKKCNLEGYFCELCMRQPPKEMMVDVAKEYLRRKSK